MALNGSRIMTNGLTEKKHQADHVGIVEKVENGIVYTIEGNAGDECKRLQYKVRHSEILGYGTYTLRTQKAKE